MEKNYKDLENKSILNEVFSFAYKTKPKDNYKELTAEELEEIFLENFGGEI